MNKNNSAVLDSDVDIETTLVKREPSHLREARFFMKLLKLSYQFLKSILQPIVAQKWKIYPEIIYTWATKSRKCVKDRPVQIVLQSKLNM